MTDRPDGVTVGHTDHGFVTLVAAKDGERLSLALSPKRALELAGTIQSEAASAHRIDSDEPLPAFDGAETPENTNLRP